VLCPQEAVLSLSPEETIQMMSAGRRFTRCLVLRISFSQLAFATIKILLFVVAG
jgi:hypothetical protein